MTRHTYAIQMVVTTTDYDASIPGVKDQAEHGVRGLRDEGRGITLEIIHSEVKELRLREFDKLF